MKGHRELIHISRDKGLESSSWDASGIGEVKSSIKEQQIQKWRIYEKLNESAVQTRENYDSALMRDKGEKLKYLVEYKINH